MISNIPPDDSQSDSTWSNINSGQTSVLQSESESKASETVHFSGTRVDLIDQRLHETHSKQKKDHKEIKSLKVSIEKITRRTDELENGHKSSQNLFSDNSTKQKQQEQDFKQLKDNIRGIIGRIDQLEARGDIAQDQSPDDLRQKVDQMLSMFCDQQLNQQIQQANQQIQLDLLKKTITEQSKIIFDLKAEQAKTMVQSVKDQAMAIKVAEHETALSTLREEVQTKVVEVSALETANQNQEEAINRTLEKLEAISSQQGVMKEEVKDVYNYLVKKGKFNNYPGLYSGFDDLCVDGNVSNEQASNINFERGVPTISTRFEFTPITLVRNARNASFLRQLELRKAEIIETHQLRRKERRRMAELESQNMMLKQNGIDNQRRVEIESQRRIQQAQHQSLTLLGVVALGVATLIHPLAGELFGPVAKVALKLAK